MEKTALSFTDFASYCLTNIRHMGLGDSANRCACAKKRTVQRMVKTINVDCLHDIFWSVVFKYKHKRGFLIAVSFLENQPLCIHLKAFFQIWLFKLHGKKLFLILIEHLCIEDCKCFKAFFMSVCFCYYHRKPKRASLLMTLSVP